MLDTNQSSAGRKRPNDDGSNDPPNCSSTPSSSTTRKSSGSSSKKIRKLMLEIMNELSPPSPTQSVTLTYPNVSSTDQSSSVSNAVGSASKSVSIGQVVDDNRKVSALVFPPLKTSNANDVSTSVVGVSTAPVDSVGTSSLLVSNDNGADVTADMACEDVFTDFFGINESKLDVEEFDALVACAEKVLLANILRRRWSYSRNHIEYPNPWNSEWITGYQACHGDVSPWLQSFNVSSSIDQFDVQARHGVYDMAIKKSLDLTEVEKFIGTCRRF